MMLKDIVLPEISENVNEAEVVRILVNIGDRVETDQSLMELETQKAIFEIPAPEAGTIKEIQTREGETVTVGQVLARFEPAGKTGEKSKASKPEKSKSPAEPPPDKAEEKTSPEKAEEKPAPAEKKKTQPSPEPAPAAEQKPASVSSETTVISEPVPAAPHVRRLAREIGVDIHQVKGSGPGGRISEEDVKAYAKERLKGGAAGGRPVYTLPDLSVFGPVHREPMSKIREVTADNMAQAWVTVPLVSQNDMADITELEKARRELSPKIKEDGGKLTLTAILVKVLAAGLKTFPKFNAVPDMRTRETVFRDYIHIGIAVDTERGLLVPVIRDADQKSLLEISRILPELAEKARTKKLMPDALEGACMSISNLGGFGVGHFTPLVSGPQVAILGVGGARETPVWQEGRWIPRLQLPLTLSYDHRLIDGAEGARFIRWISGALGNPFVLALEGGL